MNREHKKFMKKKEREKESRRKVLLRREAIRAKAKEDAAWQLEEQKAQPKREPIRKQVSKEQAKAIKEKIKRNNEILEFLEEEGKKEVKVSDISISEMVADTIAEEAARAAEPRIRGLMQENNNF